MDYVRQEIKEGNFVEEAVDPDSIEGFGHVEEDCACWPLFAKVPVKCPANRCKRII